MPESLILLTAGETTTAKLPNTAQEVSSTWHHDAFFPQGVFLHRMMHLSREMVAELEVTSYLARDRVETVSISLMMDARLSRGNVRLAPNFHEIPNLLDTQLFYGNLLVLLTIDGSTIIPLTRRQYDIILNNNVSHSVSRQKTKHVRNLFCSSSYEFSSLGATPNSDDAMDMSISDDDIEIESMDCFSDDCSDEESPSPNNKPEFLNICLNPQKLGSRALPVRPVF